MKKLVLFMFVVILPAGAWAEECPPTGSKAPGTHYQPIDRMQTNIGKGLIVSGEVRSARDCAPIARARVAHWQANAKGDYTDDMRAYLRTDSKGRFRFQTEYPGGVEVPHIYFMVIAPGHKTLITQWVAEGEHRLPSIVFDINMEPVGESAKQ